MIIFVHRMNLVGKMRNRILLVFVALLALLCYAESERVGQGIGGWVNCSPDSLEKAGGSEKMARLEFPVITDARSEYLLYKTGFVVNYNVDWRIPNWVAYELTDEETNGTIERARHFKVDEEAPYPRVETSDYSHSGYDRGHMIPAADVKWSQQAMYDSFYMTNICPQNPNLNRGDWNDLEELCRTWAKKWGRLYIACGPVVVENPQRIGDVGVVVPAAFFKVVLRMGEEVESIGFLFANRAGSKPLQTYAMSVDDLETVCNMDFFSLLPDSLEECVEQELDVRVWNW